MERKYPSGEAIHVHDRVKIGRTLNGVVVAVIDAGEYDEALAPEKGWSHYKTGVLVMTDEAGLVLYREPGHIAEFVKVRV